MMEIWWEIRFTAAANIESLGWKLLGPSSHKNPSPCTVVMLPPTLSLASVTSTFPTTDPCLP